MGARIEIARNFWLEGDINGDFAKTFAALAGLTCTPSKYHQSYIVDKNIQFIRNLASRLHGTAVHARNCEDELMSPMEYILVASAEDEYLNALIDLLFVYETPAACARSILFCIRNHSKKCARTLVEKYNVRMPANAVLAAAHPLDIPMLRFVLFDLHAYARGADPNAQDPDGNNALHFLCYRMLRVNGRAPMSDCVRALIEAGVPRNARNSDGQTPLQELLSMPAEPPPLLWPLSRAPSPVFWADVRQIRALLR